MGLRSGEYFGRKKSLAPAARMSGRLALWLERDDFRPAHILHL
jgi:hypothetical protein